MRAVGWHEDSNGPAGSSSWVVGVLYAVILYYTFMDWKLWRRVTASPIDYALLSRLWSRRGPIVNNAGMINIKMLKSPKFCNLKVFILGILSLVRCTTATAHNGQKTQSKCSYFNAAWLFLKQNYEIYHYRRQPPCSWLFTSAISHQYSMTRASFTLNYVEQLLSKGESKVTTITGFE